VELPAALKNAFVGAVYVLTPLKDDFIGAGDIMTRS
jgi:hypothetical protein